MKRIFTLVLAALIVIGMTAVSFGENESIEIEIPSFVININGTDYDSSKAQYPMIVYKNITYFPMTWTLSRALGLEANYSNENGLEIESGNESKTYEITEGNVNSLNTKYNASSPNYKIAINGTEIDNSKEEYPILNFRSITYFPLTWRFAYEMFNWDYTYSEEFGLNISSKEKVKIDNTSKETVIDEEISEEKFITRNIDEIIVTEFIKGSITPEVKGDDEFYTYTDELHSSHILTRTESGLFDSKQFSSRFNGYKVVKGTLYVNEYSEHVGYINLANDNLSYLYESSELSGPESEIRYTSLFAKYFDEETLSISLMGDFSNKRKKILQEILLQATSNNSDSEKITEIILEVISERYIEGNELISEVINNAVYNTEMYIGGYFVEFSIINRNMPDSHLSIDIK